MSDERRLFFLRHGLADWSEWNGPDAERPLTREGKLRMQREADTMDRLGVAFDAILTSPLVRAAQTAEIVASHLGLVDRLRTEPRLACGFGTDDLTEILAELADDCLHVLLVGHEPDLSTVIGAITGGSEVVCKKGSLARVDLLDARQPRGHLVWLLQPRVLLE